MRQVLFSYLEAAVVVTDFATVRLWSVNFFYKKLFILHNIPLNLIAILLLAGIILFNRLGVAIGNYQKKHNPNAKSETVGPLESALLGLLALLLSFTFSLSAAKHDTRRSLIITEANNIETGILRADLYPDSVRKQFRKDLRQYLEARIDYYNAGEDEDKLNAARLKAVRILDGLWKKAARASRETPVFDRDNQMIPALNSMDDSITNRDAARSNVPDSIIFLLITLSLLGSFVIGYCKREKKSDWIMFSIYAMMMVFTIYTIMDLDRPFSGFIQTDHAHQKILDLRELFKEE